MGGEVPEASEAGSAWPEAIVTRGPDGRQLTARQAQALLGDEAARRVALDEVRCRTEPGGGQQVVQVSTVFLVEPAELSEQAGGPWETLVTQERGEEVLRLRWPDRQIAGYAHNAVCRSLAGTNLLQVVLHVRDQVRAHVAQVVGRAAADDREQAERGQGGV